MKWHAVPRYPDWMDWLSGQCPESSTDTDPEEIVPDRGTLIVESMEMLAELLRMAA